MTSSVPDCIGILPSELFSHTLSLVIDEAIQNRDYATVSSIFKVSSYFNSVASDFFRRAWITTQLAEESTDLRLKLTCITDSKMQEGGLITQSKIITSKGELVIAYYAACHRVRLASLVFMACFQNVEIGAIYPLHALVETTRDIMFTKSLLNQQELRGPMANFLQQHSILWLKDKKGMAAVAYRYAFDEVLGEEDSEKKKVSVIKSSNPAFLLPFQGYIKEFPEASPLSWVENSYLALLLFCPTTQLREALFCDGRVLNPTFNRPDVRPEQYDEYQVAYVLIQEMFKTRKSNSLFDNLQTQLNVNVCLLPAFIRHCIHFQNASDSLFQDLLQFASKQSPRIRDVFCKHLEEIILIGTVRYPLTKEMDERELFQNNPRILEQFRKKYEFNNYVLEHKLEPAVQMCICKAILELCSDHGVRFFCDNITVFDHEYCKEYLAKSPSFKSLSAAELQGLLAKAAAHFLSFGAEKRTVESIDCRLICLENIVNLVDLAHPEIFESSFYISWGILFSKRDVEMLSKVLYDKNIILTQVKALLPIFNYVHKNSMLDLLRAIDVDVPDFYQHCLNHNRNLNSLECTVLNELMTDDSIVYLETIFYNSFYSEKQLIMFERWCKKLSTMPNHVSFFLGLLHNTKTLISKSTLENLAFWGVKLPRNSLVFLAPQARTVEIIGYLITQFECDPREAVSYWTGQKDVTGVQRLQDQIRLQNKRKLRESKHESVKRTVQLFEIEQER